MNFLCMHIYIANVMYLHIACYWAHLSGINNRVGRQCDYNDARDGLRCDIWGTVYVYVCDADVDATAACIAFVAKYKMTMMVDWMRQPLSVVSTAIAAASSPPTTAIVFHCHRFTNRTLYCKWILLYLNCIHITKIINSPFKLNWWHAERKTVENCT